MDLAFSPFFTLPNELVPDIASTFQGFFTEEKALEKFTTLPIEPILSFLDSSMRDKNYAKSHQDFLKKLWTKVDNQFDHGLKYEQQKKVLKVISACPENMEEYLPKNLIFLGPTETWSSNRLWLSSQMDYFFSLTRSASSQKKPIDNPSQELNLDLRSLSAEAFRLLTGFLEGKTLPGLTNLEVIKEILNTAQEWGFDELIDEIQDKCVINHDNAIFYFEMTCFFENLLTLKRRVLDYLRCVESISFSKAKEIYQYAQQKNYKEIQEWATSHLFNHLKVKIQAILKKRLVLNALRTHQKKQKKEKSLDPFLQLRDVMNEICTLGSISSEAFKKALTTFSAQELQVFMHQFPSDAKHLNLSVYDNQQIANLAEHLPNDVVELDLSGKGLSQKTIETIASHCPSLKKLNLANAVKWNTWGSYNRHADESWEALTKFRDLTELDVSAYPDFDPHLREMLEANAEHLVVLRMSHFETLLDFHSFRHHFEIIATSGKNLKELDISYTHIPKTLLDKLFANQCICEGLERLSLAGNKNLKADKLELIGSKFPNLRSLDLSEMAWLDEKTLEKILAALGKSSDQTSGESKLEHLNIMNTNYCKSSDPTDQTPMSTLWDRQRNLISAIIAHCPNLISLIVHELTDEEIISLSKQCPHLTRLHIKCISSIETLLEQNIHLKSLKIDEIKDLEIQDCQALLRKVAKKWPDLEMLEIKNTCKKIQISIA